MSLHICIRLYKGPDLISIDVWRGRATNEDLTFRAAGGDGIGCPSVGRSAAVAPSASVGLSHVKTSGGEKDHETNKFLANCHRGEEDRGRRKPFGE